MNQSIDWKSRNEFHLKNQLTLGFEKRISKLKTRKKNLSINSFERHIIS